MTTTPERSVSVDWAASTPVSQQTTGIVYGKDEDERRKEAANTVPRLVCPNCLEPVTRLDVANQYTKADGSVVKVIPPCPVTNLGIQPFFYSCQPCGCRVSGEWASTWAGEMNRRLDGRQPKHLQAMSGKAREALLKGYERGLMLLRMHHDSETTPRATRDAAGIWAIIVADQIQRLCPGGHNRATSTMPMPETVDNPTEHTATANQFDPLANVEMDLATVASDDYPPGYPMPKRAEAVQLVDVTAEQDNRPTRVSDVLSRHNQRVAARMREQVRAPLPNVHALTVNEAITLQRWGGSALLDQPTTHSMLTILGLSHQDVRGAHDYLVRTPAAKLVLGSTLDPEHQTTPYVSHLFADILDNLKEYSLGQRFYLSKDAMTCLRALVTAKAITPSGEALPPASAPPPITDKPLPVAPPDVPSRRTRRRTIRRLEE